TKFKRVGARARVVGAHVAIYIDTLAPAGGLDSAHLDTLRQVFDTLLYPLDTATFGSVSDLDANGVVIALMTPVVNALVTKTACGSGFIAGFFFPGDLDLSASPDSSNHGEVFYSIVADPTATLSCGHPGGGGRELAVHAVPCGPVRTRLARQARSDHVGRCRQCRRPDRTQLRHDRDALGARQLGVRPTGLRDAGRAQRYLLALPDADLRIAASAGSPALPEPIPARPGRERGKRREPQRDPAIRLGGVRAGAAGAGGAGIHAAVQRRPLRFGVYGRRAAAQRDPDPLRAGR